MRALFNPKLTKGSVEKAVASLDGVVDGIRAGLVVDLPETEANDGHLHDYWMAHSASSCSPQPPACFVGPHLMSAVELDGRGNHGVK